MLLFWGRGVKFFFAYENEYVKYRIKLKHGKNSIIFISPKECFAEISFTFFFFGLCFGFKQFWFLWVTFFFFLLLLCASKFFGGYVSCFEAQGSIFGRPSIFLTSKQLLILHGLLLSILGDENCL